ncbi:hypothetical protein ACFQ3J_07780 [Paenibacillus provencensis]|uniref:Uncharacterized protein n=1 Tax=Paenibacillus provencensis TaxID=441151 RepID=A0ABW3PT71_9BACL|nr:hypothetical protein [Paenibacillus sp. MER 78]MCM3129554.1 hypothetical protein [Paenibacillus sp. MER 78]
MSYSLKFHEPIHIQKAESRVVTILQDSIHITMNDFDFDGEYYGDESDDYEE